MLTESYALSFFHSCRLDSKVEDITCLLDLPKVWHNEAMLRHNETGLINSNFYWSRCKNNKRLEGRQIDKDIEWNQKTDRNAR